MSEQFANSAATTLTAGIDASQTTLVVASAVRFPTTGTFRIIIGTELLTVTGVSGSTFTVTRGAESTVAAAHSLGASVTCILTAAALLQLKADSTGTPGSGDLNAGLSQVIGIGGVPLSGSLGIGELWKHRGSALVPGKSMPGFYDARDYGAVGDGVTDDSAAVQNMINTVLPTKVGCTFVFDGAFYFANNIHLTRACNIVGSGAGAAGGSNNLPGTRFTFAAGKGLIGDAQTNSIVTNGLSGYSRITDIAFFSDQLSALQSRANSSPYVVGDIIGSPTNNDNRYYFECIGTTGNTAGSPPDFIFCYVPYVGTVRPADGTAVVLNQLVHDISASSTVVFKVTTAGVLGTGAPSWDTTIGNTTSDGGAVFTAIGATDRLLVDGGVTWACKHHSAITMHQRMYVEYCGFYNFTNYAVHIQAGSYTEQTDANGFLVFCCVSDRCGGGIATRGSDSQTGTVFMFSSDNAGFYWPLGANTGGVGVWDGSELGSLMVMCKVAGSSGPGYMLGWQDILGPGTAGQTSNPLGGTLVACYMEADCMPILANGGSAHGGNLGHLPVGSLVTVGGPGTFGDNNIASLDTVSPKNSFFQLAVPGYDFVGVTGNTDNASAPYYKGTSYECSALGRAGWWSETLGQTNVGLSFSGRSATEGRGWSWCNKGQFLGGVSGDSFIGQYFHGYDLASLTDVNVRRGTGGVATGGIYKIGDRFSLIGTGATGTYTGYIVSADGRRANVWVANEILDVGSLHEPTTNGYPIPAAGEMVFQVVAATGDQKSDSVEPGWGNPALNPGTALPWVIGDQIVDHNVTWELVSFVPTYNYWGLIGPSAP